MVPAKVKAAEKEASPWTVKSTPCNGDECVRDALAALQGSWVDVQSPECVYVVEGTRVERKVVTKGTSSVFFLIYDAEAKVLRRGEKSDVHVNVTISRHVQCGRIEWQASRVGANGKKRPNKQFIWVRQA